MKYLISCLLMLTAVCASAQPKHATGANFNPVTLAKTPQKVRLSFRSFRGLPSSYSLEAYCPAPGNQGNHDTCVVFANAYGVATILYAKTVVPLMAEIKHN